MALTRTLGFQGRLGSWLAAYNGQSARGLGCLGYCVLNPHAENLKFGVFGLGRFPLILTVLNKDYNGVY